MATFAQYLNNETSIKFAVNCILGFHVEDYVSDREYLYALDKGGQAYRADAPLGTNSFDNNQRTWYAVNTIPNAAKFIGNYPPIKKIGIII